MFDYWRHIQSRARLPWRGSCSWCLAFAGATTKNSTSVRRDSLSVYVVRCMHLESALIVGAFLFPWLNKVDLLVLYAGLSWRGSCGRVASWLRVTTLHGLSAQR